MNNIKMQCLVWSFVILVFTKNTAIVYHCMPEKKKKGNSILRRYVNSLNWITTSWKTFLYLGELCSITICHGGCLTYFASNNMEIRKRAPYQRNKILFNTLGLCASIKWDNYGQLKIGNFQMYYWFWLWKFKLVYKNHWKMHVAALNQFQSSHLNWFMDFESWYWKFMPFNGLRWNFIHWNWGR